MKIAILGASPDKSRMSNKALRAYSLKGWEVYAVNPNYIVIEGLKSYKSVLELPKMDVISFYVSPVIGEKLVNNVIKAGPKTVYLNPGSDSDLIVKKLKEAGIDVLLQCSILALGLNPKDF
ncbi:MAG TPA: CoA-binding protein [Candidatus Nanoarchaeia archaeon]|nr:CoA-binding protein [Candidatus Nanoarchaeia archaeon]